jgi:hypothetical protein
MSERITASPEPLPAAGPSDAPPGWSTRRRRHARGPLGGLLDLLSSIWTGIALLAVLFVYSSVGSALYQVRQLRIFEMTEFEWFHWWPFKAIVGLICLCIVLATLRRIPFRPVNYGVWMIHGGILVLAAGCVVYFSTKVEGDAPVARRQVRVQAPGEEPRTTLAMPGNRLRCGAYDIQVVSIDPQWEILSGQDAGRRAYSVNVMVQGPRQTFIRQLIADYPQYTEDLVRSTEPGPPWTRARKALGTALVDEDLRMDLVYAPQEWFYLSNDISKSWALYLREVVDGLAPGEWVMRPIEGLPLYNDFVADLDDVWLEPGDDLKPDPIRVSVPPADPADPLPGAAIEVTSYLRYASTLDRRRYGSGPFDPAVRVAVEGGGGREEYELAALDPAARMEPGGRMFFEWVGSEEGFERLRAEMIPTLRIVVPDAAVEVQTPIGRVAGEDPGLPFTPVEGTGYSYRVKSRHDHLQIPGTSEKVAVAIVEVKTAEGTFDRWVADDPARSRDMPAAGASAGHAEALPPDPRIVMEYRPPRGVLAIVGGPEEERLRLVLWETGGERPDHAAGELRVVPLTVGRSEMLGQRGDVSLRVLQFAAHSSVESRPYVHPAQTRNPDLRAQLSMVKVEVPGASPQTAWLPFHHWSVRDASATLGRMPFEPTPLDLPDGRRVELLFSRKRVPLPHPVVLEDFEMITHVGGFTGQTVSVLNWTSRIRFETTGGWSDALPVSVNQPREFGGLWYFQAQWDPPRQGYAGLNFTVLGVGSRHGVNLMLLGCCLTVIGMVYAFYVKPVIKRRRQKAAEALAAAVAGDGQARQRPTRLRAAVGAGGEERP